MKVVIYEVSGSVMLINSGESASVESLIMEGGKRVPAGVSFWIVDANSLPDEPQETWILDASDMGIPVGIGGTYVEKAEEMVSD